MHHRTRELRAAVARRERSQGHLRAATATVGAAGVATAGAVAFILPGATHTAAASTQTARAAQPTTAASSPAAPAAATAVPGRPLPRMPGGTTITTASAGGAAAGCRCGVRVQRPGPAQQRPGAGAQRGAIARRVRRLLTPLQRACPGMIR